MATQESIYRIIVDSETGDRPKSLRPSIHNPLCPPSYSTFGIKGTTSPGVKNVGGDTEPARSGYFSSKTYSTMGPPRGLTRPNTLQPLIRHSKAKKVLSLKQLKELNTLALETTRRKDKIKPDIPKMSDKPIQGIKSDKDFVTYNAVISMLMRPPAQKDVPNYLKKKNYGKVPSYLSENKRQIQREYDFIASIRNNTQIKDGPQCRELPDCERLALLEDLRKTCKTLNEEYQGMTIKTKMDALCKIRRKEYLEQQLTKIEYYIQALSNGPVFITEDGKNR